MIIRIQFEAETRAFVEATAEPPFLPALGPVRARAVVDAVQAGSVAKLPVDIEDRWIEGGPHGQVSIRILRPQNAQGTLPVIVYLHGGGWVLGNTHTHDRLIRELAVGAGAALVFVNYSLSPEAKYPTAIEESYAVVMWIAQHGLIHSLDPERLAVAGDNVGGNLAAVVTLLAKERGGPAIRWQVMFYPVTDAALDTDSAHLFAEGYFLRRDMMVWFWSQYIPEPTERKEITASPLRASTEQLKGLPPALVIVSEADVLRDEGEAYANKLCNAGVPVTAVRFQGTIHDFVMLNALAETATARGAIMLATAWLRSGFSGRS